MNYKLLVLDLDGTLTNSKKEITPFTRETLLQAQEKGLHLVLASGRPTYGIVPLAEELNMKQYGGFILSFNGGKVIDLMTDKVLFEQALPPDIVPVLYNRSKEAGLAILSYNGKYILSEHPENKYVQYESFLTKMKIKATDDFLRDLHQPADKCLVVGEPEMLVPLEEKLRQELGKRINVYRSEAFYLELVPKGIDKAASLSRLLERTRIKQEEVIAIGDGFNDVSMIRFAGLGVAMANAQPPVKANADRITQYTNVIVRAEENRPQPIYDVFAGTPDRARGMASSVGRIRCSNGYYKMWVVSHNTLRGGAGGSMLNAEYAYKKDIL